MGVMQHIQKHKRHIIEKIIVKCQQLTGINLYNYYLLQNQVNIQTILSHQLNKHNLH